MHMRIMQVRLGLVAAGSLVAVYAATTPQSAMATPPVSRLADLGPHKTIADADCVGGQNRDVHSGQRDRRAGSGGHAGGAALGRGERTAPARARSTA